MPPFYSSDFKTRQFIRLSRRRPHEPSRQTFPLHRMASPRPIREKPFAITKQTFRHSPVKPRPGRLQSWNPKFKTGPLAICRATPAGQGAPRMAVKFASVLCRRRYRAARRKFPSPIQRPVLPSTPRRSWMRCARYSSFPKQEPDPDWPRSRPRCAHRRVVDAWPIGLRRQPLSGVRCS